MDLLLCLVVLLSICLVSGGVREMEIEPTANKEQRQTYNRESQQLINITETHRKASFLSDLANSEYDTILQLVKQTLQMDKDHVNSQCNNDTNTIVNDIITKPRKPYAMQFLDAQVKIPYGIMDGRWMWNGDYQECIRIVSPENTHGGKAITGKYFTAEFHLPSLGALGDHFSIGLCLPASCDNDDVFFMVNQTFSKVFPSNQSSLLNVFASKQYHLSGGAICSLVVTIIIVCIVIVGTVSDYIVSKKTESLDHKQWLNESQSIVNSYEGKGILEGETGQGDDIKIYSNKILDILKTFSFFNNTKKLMSTSTSNGPLACLNGMRVLSMCWVIMGHTYSFSELFMENPLIAITTIIKRFTFQPIENGTFSVDSFFFLSGLLVAYLGLKTMKEKGRMNWLYYFGHRYWRLTPLYAFVMLLFTNFTPLLMNGTYQWLFTEPSMVYYKAANECKTYWWSNLLYINNFYPNFGSMSGCMGWSWYLANDMQFYVFLSPIVLLLLHKRRAIGLFVSFMLIASCIAVRGFLTSHYELNQNGQATKHLNDPIAKNGVLYQRPFARWSVYIVGMVTGYILQTTNCKIRLNKIIVLLGWAAATAVAMAVTYGLYYFNDHPGSVMSKVESGFYNSMARTAWSLSLSWLVVACATGNGGWINSILGWSFWAPFGRLTYAAYLVHPIILFIFYVNMAGPLRFTDELMVYVFIGNVVISYAFAYVVSMLVEAPMMQLEKVILRR